MSDYKKEIRESSQIARFALTRFLPLFIGVLVVLAIVGFTMRSLGYWGGTIVERKVFENSYQRSESLKSQIATDEAAIAEIDRKLSNPNLDADTRYNLEAQKAAARIRIAAAKSKQ